MESSRILLIYSSPEGKDPWMQILPSGLGSLQTFLVSRGHSCRIANLSGMDQGSVERYLRQQQPAMVGFSLFTFNRNRTAQLIRWTRSVLPSAVLLAGGPHATHASVQVLKSSPELDGLIMGEGEQALLSIAEGLAGKGSWKEAPSLWLQGVTSPNPQAPLWTDLDALGQIPETFNADFCDPVNQLQFLNTSRGCPARCAFCNTPGFWGNRLRFRSPDHVLEEMRILRDRYGLIYFSFRDDSFTAHRTRTLDLMQILGQSNLDPIFNAQSRVNLVDEERLVALARGGCEFLQFGLEHASAPMLKLLCKDLDLNQARWVFSLVRKAGIRLGVYLITGIPGESREDVEACARLLQEIHPEDVQLSPLALYPGTALYQQWVVQAGKEKEYLSRREDTSLFARNDAHTSWALKYLAKFARLARKPFSQEEFRSQRKYLGYCAVTNLVQGEQAEAQAAWIEAEAVYTEIIRQQPSNPWGWLRRAQLKQRTKRIREARQDAQEVLHLVPRNAEARSILA